MIYRNSGDEQVRSAGVMARSCASARKWASDASIVRAERKLRLKTFTGNLCTEKKTENHAPTVMGKSRKRSKTIQAEVQHLEVKKKKVGSRNGFLGCLEKLGPPKEKTFMD